MHVLQVATAEPSTPIGFFHVRHKTFDMECTINTRPRGEKHPRTDFHFKLHSGTLYSSTIGGSIFNARRFWLCRSHVRGPLEPICLGGGVIIIHGLLPLAPSLAQPHSADSVPYSVFSPSLHCCSWTPLPSLPLRAAHPSMAKTAMGKKKPLFSFSQHYGCCLLDLLPTLSVLLALPKV